MSVHLSQTEMLEKIQQLGLMLVDLNLFLDTHPESKEALADYKKIYPYYEGLKQEYNTNFGPLSVCDVVTSKDGYTWINDPWPWERMK